MPVAATVTDYRSPIMLAPQSGQTKLRIAEIKLELVFVTTANEAISVSPFFAVVLHRRMHRILSEGSQARSREGAPGAGAAAPRVGFKCKSN
jgi:hypothetical protein